MKETRQHYTEEFKRKTVQHIEETKKTLTQASKELDVSVSSLSDWMKKYSTLKNDKSFQTQVFVDYERLKKLEQQTRELEEENAILKKAMHFFTKNPE